MNPTYPPRTHRPRSRPPPSSRQSTDIWPQDPSDPTSHRHRRYVRVGYRSSSRRYPDSRRGCRRPSTFPWTPERPFHRPNPCPELFRSLRRGRMTSWSGAKTRCPMTTVKFRRRCPCGLAFFNRGWASQRIRRWSSSMAATASRTRCCRRVGGASLWNCTTPRAIRAWLRWNPRVLSDQLRPCHRSNCNPSHRHPNPRHNRTGCPARCAASASVFKGS